MRHLGAIWLASASLLLCGCNPIAAFHPFYRSDDLRFDARLVGEWADDEGDLRVEHACDGGRDAYTMIWRMNDSVLRFDAHLFALGDKQFVDLRHQPYDQGDSADLGLFGHLVAGVELTEQELKAELLDLGEHYSLDALGRLDYLVDEEGHILVTAETSELQQFLEKESRKGGLLGDVAEGEGARKRPSEAGPIISCVPRPFSSTKLAPGLLDPDETILLAAQAFAVLGGTLDEWAEGVFLATSRQLVFAGWDLRTQTHRALFAKPWREIACADRGHWNDNEFEESEVSDFVVRLPFPVGEAVEFAIRTPENGGDPKSTGSAFQLVKSKLVADDDRCPRVRSGRPFLEPRNGLVVPARTGALERSRMLRDATGFVAEFWAKSGLHLTATLVHEGQGIDALEEWAHRWGEEVGPIDSRPLQVGSRRVPARLVSAKTSGGPFVWFAEVDTGDWLLLVEHAAWDKAPEKGRDTILGFLRDAELRSTDEDDSHAISESP